VPHLQLYLTTLIQALLLFIPIALMTYMSDEWKRKECPVIHNIDPHLRTKDAYDYEHIHNTVYSLAQSEHPLASHVRQALHVIEEAIDKYG
jgi:hypothetical protein